MAKNRKSEPELLLKRLGKRVRELRVEKGLSQEGLALAAGLDRSYVGGVERGQRNIAVLNLKKIAHALGVKPSQLLEGL